MTEQATELMEMSIAAYLAERQMTRRPEPQPQRKTLVVTELTVREPVWRMPQTRWVEEGPWTKIYDRDYRELSPNRRFNIFRRAA